MVGLPSFIGGAAPLFDLATESLELIDAEEIAYDDELCIGKGLLHGPNRMGCTVLAGAAPLQKLSNVFAPGCDLLQSFKVLEEHEGLCVASETLFAAFGAEIGIGGGMDTTSNSKVVKARIPIVTLGIEATRGFHERVVKESDAATFLKDFGNRIITQITLGAYVKLVETKHASSTNVRTSESITAMTPAGVAATGTNKLGVSHETTFTVVDCTMPAWITTGGGAMSVNELRTCLSTAAELKRQECRDATAEDIMKMNLDVLAIGVRRYPRAHLPNLPALPELSEQERLMAGMAIRQLNAAKAAGSGAALRRWTAIREGFVKFLKGSAKACPEVIPEVPLQLPGAPHLRTDIYNDLDEAVTLRLGPTFWPMGWSRPIKLAAKTPLTGKVERYWYDVEVKTSDGWQRVGSAERLHKRSWALKASNSGGFILASRASGPVVVP